MTNFFYTDANGNKQGPLNTQRLQALTNRGIITPETPLQTDTGHTGLAGQIPGLNFGIIAPHQSAQATPSASVFCANCGNSVSEQAVACMSCGAKPIGHKKFCCYCSAALNPEQVVCLECGKAIEKVGIRIVAFRSPRDMGRAFRKITAKAKKQPSLVLVSIGIGGLLSVLLHFFTDSLWLIPVFGIIVLTGVLIRFPSEH
jgi:hypothetical protein